MNQVDKFAYMMNCKQRPDIKQQKLAELTRFNQVRQVVSFSRYHIGNLRGIERTLSLSLSFLQKIVNAFSSFFTKLLSQFILQYKEHSWYWISLYIEIFTKCSSVRSKQRAKECQSTQRYMENMQLCIPIPWRDQILPKEKGKKKEICLSFFISS